jgi:hypothetical protein
VIRISPGGHATAFASVPAAKTLSGIVFDTGGRFGHRLLVAGPATGGDGMVVAAIDCRGGVTTVGHGLPVFEGGFAIAPPGFGTHAGELVVPDELSGRILAITPSGQAVELAASGVEHGGDLGVESAGVVPLSGGVLVSDRGTPGNPHPGTDSVLRIEQPALAAAGVAPGDILIASEGGAVTVDLRCAESCSVRTVASGPPAAHGEGHLLGLGPVPTAAAPTPAATSTHPGGRGPLISGVVALVAGLIVFVGTRRLRARVRRQRAAG